jgi:hypothetical protein
MTDDFETRWQTVIDDPGSSEGMISLAKEMLRRAAQRLEGKDPTQLRRIERKRAEDKAMREQEQQAQATPAKDDINLRNYPVKRLDLIEDEVDLMPPEEDPDLSIFSNVKEYYDPENDDGCPF